MLLNKYFAYLAIFVAALVIISCSEDSKVVSSSSSTSKVKPTNGYYIPTDRYYTADHIWLKMIDDTSGVVGVTGPGVAPVDPVAQISWVNNWNGKVKHKPHTIVGTIGNDGLTASFDLYSPIEGYMDYKNPSILNNPSLISSDPYGDGWIFKLSGITTSDLDYLMNAAQYNTYIGQ